MTLGLYPTWVLFAGDVILSDAAAAPPFDVTVAVALVVGLGEVVCRCFRCAATYGGHKR